MNAIPAPMHIPDGFLNTILAGILWAIAVAGVGFSLWQSRKMFGERLIPLMGVLAAFIFAAQAINFPVAGGTSGHLLGGTLAAIVLGPWPAVLVMTAVVSVQALLFQDGGLVVLGANLLHMAILAPLAGWTVYHFLGSRFGGSRMIKLAAVFLAAWLSVVLAAMATALELAISGTSSPEIVFPAMTLVHMLIGLGEGLITVGAVAFLYSVRPDLLREDDQKTGSASSAVVAIGLVIALVVALFSPLASPSPDGLERVAEDLGFLANAQTPAWTVLGDYALPFLADPALSTIAAVALGTVVVFLIGLLVGRLVVRGKRTIRS